MQKLLVSELFYSLQGEGIFSGYPCHFLRLAGCNLLCKGQGWMCDTIEVWKKGRLTDIKSIADTIGDGRFVITGGEPLLQQDRLIVLLTLLSNNGEIETNGTIAPHAELLDNGKLWFNVSPKLKSSGAAFHYDPDVLLRIEQTNRASFKFVIANEDDAIEVMKNFSFLDSRNFLFMPAGCSIKELELTQKEVWKICQDYKIRMTQRAHVNTWDRTTGI